ncbi:MAG: hypothetical protein M0P27_02985 [Bacteroidales bacterium]|nr:hypothetical protein [Bacteroidales bacterium]
MLKNFLILIIAIIPVITSHSGINNYSPDTLTPTDTTKSQKYIKYSPEEIPKLSYQNFVSFLTHKVNDLTLLFGSYRPELKEHSEKKDFGQRLLVFNDKNEIVFTSIGAQDSRSFYPSYFKSDDLSPIFLLVELGDEGGTWGNLVFTISGNTIKYIGSIDLAIPEKNDCELTYYDISEYTEISKSGNKYRFDFKADTITYKPLRSDYEKNINAKEWYYLYDNDTLKLMKK